MTLTIARAKAKSNIQASITIVTYDPQNIFIVQATGGIKRRKRFLIITISVNLVF